MPKFIRRNVETRRRILGDWWELELDCGHWITRRTKAGSKVEHPVCFICNEAAAERGEAERMLTNQKVRLKLPMIPLCSWCGKACDGDICTCGADCEACGQAEKL